MTEQQNYYEDTTDRENLEVGRVIPEHPELGPILAIESPDDHPFGKSWEWAIFGCGRAAIVRSLKRG